MQEALSGVWSRHQLFVATHTALHCIFVAANPESSQPFLDVSLSTITKQDVRFLQHWHPFLHAA